MSRSFYASVALAGILLAGCGPSNPGDSSTPASATAKPIPVLSPSGISMVYLPGGEFVMGTDRGNEDETPAHRVTVTGFMMDTYEVTHAMFTEAQLPNPSHWQDNPNQPVERVRWRDAKQYCNERSLMEHLQPCYDEKTPDWDCNYEANGYRLPTEAEWEYACRAGTRASYDFGSESKLRQFAWFADNAGEQTHPVGTKQPNGWGIHDLYGNVSEWCEDVYDPEYYASSPDTNPTGPPNTGEDVKRVLRGGSWKASASMCRAELRQGERTGDSDACFYTDFCGFRCVRRATAEEVSAWAARVKP